MEQRHDESVEWYTPNYILDAAVSVMGGIDLDPCAEPAKHVPAGTHYTIDDDGLSKPWYGRVFMNPPYGRGIGKWTEKLRDSWYRDEIECGIALLPARTDTQWWLGIRRFPVCFVTGRIKFSESDTGGKFPSAIVYVGFGWVRFLEIFSKFGVIYEPVIAYMSEGKWQRLS